MKIGGEVGVSIHIEIPSCIGDALQYYFHSKKGHRKARRIKSIKRRFLKKYGIYAEGYFEYVCLKK